MARSAHGSGRGLVLSVGLGCVLGLLVGVVCMALGVGGRGPESGLWVILMPMAGAAEGLLSGGVSLATVRMTPLLLRVGLSALAVAVLTFGLGQLLLDGFQLLGLETGLAFVLGAATAWRWPRWTAPRAAGPRGSRRGVHAKGAIAALALLLPVLMSCGGRDAAPPPATTTGSLVGRWVSAPTPSQMGEIIHTYEFGADGRYSMSLEFVQARIPKMESAGTYDARDGTLRLQREGKETSSSSMRYAFEGNELVLRERSDTYRLRKR